RKAGLNIASATGAVHRRRTREGLPRSGADETLAQDQTQRHDPFGARERSMCRNIKTLFNFDPPASDEEIHASALQFVRKLSGFTHPSQANAAAFETAVEEVAAAARRLIASLQTSR